MREVVTTQTQDALRKALYHILSIAMDERVDSKAIVSIARNAIAVLAAAEPEQQPTMYQHQKPIVGSNGETIGYSDWQDGRGLEWWPYRVLLAAPLREKKEGVRVWRVSEPSHPYPWRFDVTHNGTNHIYAGIPNQCETMAEAYQRAAERYGWMLDGTYDQRYAAPSQENP